MNTISNKYIGIYIDNYIKTFRSYVAGKYAIKINGLGDFISANNDDTILIIDKLQSYGFEVELSGGQDVIDEIQVEYTCENSKGGGKKHLIIEKHF